MGRLAREKTAEPVSRDQIPRRELGQGNLHFPCSGDHELYVIVWSYIRLLFRVVWAAI